MKTLTFVAWNTGMFQATGEKGAYCFDVELTKEQIEKINRMTYSGCSVEEIIIKVEDNNEKV